LSIEKARAEIADSKKELEQSIGCEVRHFCYPYGGHSTEHQQMAREAGYISATTTRRGRILSGDDLFTLRRIMVARATNCVQFLLKIASAYEDKRG
jgi:peptidoglycan/xylan/chitin deacetylase (PgdA/CDA1 family)